MISRFVLTTLVGIGAALWALMLTTRGLVITPSFFLPLSFVVGAISLLLWIFDKWIWAWPWMDRLTQHPDIRGTWKVSLRSGWVNPNGQKLGVIEAYFVVRQTYTTLHLQLFTRNSESASLVTKMIGEADGIYTLIGVYQNIPNVLMRSQSPVHHGGIILRLAGTPPGELAGSYWTDRNTVGEISAYRASRKQAGSFTAAQQLAQ